MAIATVNPATGETLRTFEALTSEEIEKRLVRAEEAYREHRLTSFADRARLLDAVASMTVEELRSPNGWSWAYDCQHGHVRKHLAMVGRWFAATGWPGA